MNNRKHFILMFVVALLVLSGCGPRVKESIYSSPEFDPNEVKLVLVTPLMDLRIDKSKEFGSAEKVQNKTVEALKERGYEAIKLDSIPKGIPPIEEELKRHHPDWLANLNIKNGRYLMVLCLNDFETRITLGSTAMTELSGYIYDLQTLSLLWHHKGVGRAGSAGLVGILFTKLDTWQSIDNAINELVSGIPIRGK